MRALGPTRLDRQPVRVVEESVRISLWGVLAAWLARKLWRLLLAILRSPSTLAILAVLTVAVVVGRRYGPVPLLIAAGVVIVVLIGWRLRWPAGFQRWVRWPVRAWWRTGLIYRWRWSNAMTGAGLGRKRHDTEYLPQLLRVRSTRSVDRVRVRMLPGQTLDDYAAVADRLAQTFGALDCRVRSVPRRVPRAGAVAAGRRPARRRSSTRSPPTRTRSPAVCRWHWRRTAPSGGCSCSAPTCWWSARPVRGKGR